MHCKQWIFDMDGTLTDSMTVVWEGAPDALLRRYGRTPRGDLRATLLNMGMQEGAQYLIREYGLPLTEESYFSVMREVIAELYETVELKPGVRTMLAKLQAEGARMCICSNTWAEQCRTVLTRLGIAQYFSFIVEAQGVLHKSRPEVFFECMSRLGGADPAACAVCEDAVYAAATAHKAGDYVIVETARGIECGEVVQGVKEIAASAASSCPGGMRWTGHVCNKKGPQRAVLFFI